MKVGCPEEKWKSGGDCLEKGCGSLVYHCVCIGGEYGGGGSGQYERSKLLVLIGPTPLMTDTGGMAPSPEDVPSLSGGGLKHGSSSRRFPRKCFSGSSTVEA